MMRAPMGLLLDSGLRAFCYCLRGRVIALSLLPMVLMLVLAAGLAYFYWHEAVHAMRTLLDAWGVSSVVVGSLETWGLLGRFDASAVLASLLVVFLAMPLLGVLVLFVVTFLLTPVLTEMVAQRRFPDLARKNGGGWWSSLLWAAGSTALALLALGASMPLRLVPPLVLVLPPLIWGWLTYRVMAFDALAVHASPQERRAILRRHRPALLVMGILTGYLGTAPSFIWASGAVFAAGFLFLVPLAVWIFTLLLAFSSLWFAHYCLAALARLRARPRAGAADTVVEVRAQEIIERKTEPWLADTGRREKGKE